MKVRVKVAFDSYCVGDIIPDVPSLYAGELIENGFVERVVEPTRGQGLLQGLTAGLKPRKKGSGA